MLGLVLGLFFKGNAWWEVNPKFADASGVTWESAIQKVKTEKTKSDGFVAKDTENKALLEKFNSIGEELVASSEGKGTWVEIYSALYQALPKDPEIQKMVEQGAIAIDPAEYGFEDRKELYIDHVESKFFKDLAIWYGDVKPINDRMDDVSDEKLAAALQGNPDAAAEETTEADPVGDDLAEEDPFTGKSGWVIEIAGHHFHNSIEQVRAGNAQKSFLLNTLIENLREKTDVLVPTDGVDNDLFAYSDIGLLYPTITRSEPRTPKRIIFDPTQTVSDESASGGMGRGGGMGMGMGMGGGNLGGNIGGNLGGMGRGGAPQSGGRAPEESSENVYDVYEYKFVVQIAWIPRTPQERIEARKAREEAEAAKLAAAAEAAEQATELDAEVN